MKKMHPSFPLLAFLFLTKISIGQTDISIGQWKEHLPFSNGVYVTQSDDKIYYATRYAVLEVDKQERSVRRMTKVEGLSDVGVKLVKYNRGSKILVIVYDDSKVDLVSESGILTLPSIGDAPFLGGKTIFDIYMANDSIAYFAANYGITTLNLKQGLFPNTIKTPVEVRSVRIFEDKIYAATDDGLYVADPNAGYNINDFSNWEWLNGTKGLPQVFESDAMTLFNGQLYLDVNDSLYSFNGSEAAYVFHFDTLDLTFLTSEGEHLLAGFFCGPSCKGQVFSFDQNLTSTNKGSSCLIFPRYAIEDEKGTLWYADDIRDFYVQDKDAGCTSFSVNSPYSINTYQLDVANGKVWVAGGGVDLTFSALGRTEGFYGFVDGEWTAYNLRVTPELAGISDFLDIKTDPVTGKIYAAAFWDALVCLDLVTGEFKIFNETNSTLQGAQLDESRTRVTGLAFDAENNLWMCNHNAPKPLAVMTNTGDWYSFELPCLVDDQIQRVVIDALGYKWMFSSGNSTGIIVFDEGEDLSSSADDRCVVLNASNSVLPTNEVTSMEVDRDGSVWVGTKLGAAVFQCDPFSGECPGSRPFVTVDGFGANLLEDIEVRAIAVDGANRKWFGTGAGVFVMSPEGNTQIAHFTAENSPLFDDGITDIDFNDETGEVYIGTLRGLISYRAEATSAPSYHPGAVVFPNPVRENYFGPIAIKGLAEDSTVKITDVSGQLVYETEALGGQAIWDGNDYNGRRANTGVYLVYATNRNSNDPQVAVAKILLMK
ncbi:MAG: T9SS type A sorting domain-containing protein [Bacteroidetes bacterium]|nr:T9SS type A sorting domain-containing protein [Bacteroidota bacterium]